MKTNLLKFLFKVFSFLADKTNGAKMFVKPKLWLGALLVGSMAILCKASTANTADSRTDVEQKDTANTQAADTIPIKTIDENILCYVIVEQMPVFPGGETALMEFLKQNIHYPDSAQQKGIQGRVVVRFIVNVDGSVSDIDVIRSIDPLLDAEAVRVIKLLPKWTAGKQNGENVPVWFTMPINFKLDKKDGEKN